MAIRAGELGIPAVIGAGESLFPALEQVQEALPGLQQSESHLHSMISVGVTQRVAVMPGYGERRDCLDQNWPSSWRACGLSALVLPNIPEIALGAL